MSKKEVKNIKQMNKNDINFVIYPNYYQRIFKFMLFIFLNLIFFISTNSMAATSEAVLNDEYERDAKETIEEAKKLKGYEVKFDYQNHPKEREIAYQYIIKEYLKYLSEEERKNSTPLKEDIGIFLYDIDNDGKEEIFVYINDSGSCGSGGCSFIILKTSANLVAKAMMWNDENNDSINAREDILILTSKNLKVNDLLFSGKNIWRWQGNYYSRVTD